jgi:ABC-type sugar transport system ATPase subunit
MITDADVELLISVLKALKAQGVAIVFISHKFNEVFALADRAVILRDGVVVGEAQTAKLNHDQIVTWMVGTPPAAYLATTEEKAHHPSKNSRVLLAAKKLRSLHAPPFSLAVHEGEVVGLIGLVGSGRSEILRVLAGIDAIKGGELMVAGQVVCKHNVKEMMKRGVLLLPEDRKMQGLFLDQSLGFNALIYNLDAYSRFGFVMFGAENQAFDDAQKLNRADVNSGWRVARTLSGGNQQRLMLGKTLLRGGKVLLLDELSAGVDVTTKIDSLRRVQEFAHQGMGILFTSSQWEEVTDIADRLYVVANGNIVGEFAKGQASHADFMHLIIENTSESSKQGNCR